MTDELIKIEFDNYCPQNIEIFVKQSVFALSSRKLQSLIKIAELQRYYQCNPVRFISDFFNIELLDAQAYIIQRAWTCPNVLLVCTRGFGKSTIIDLFTMAKDMLYCNYWTYIASGSGNQAQETFTTLEKLANDNIDTMIGSTGYIFKQEVEIKNAAGDGFSHSSDGFTYSLYNGSMTQTLNSNVDRKRGKRGNVIFDECAFLSAELMNVYAAFAIVNKSFKTGRDRDGNLIDMNRSRTIPNEIPNQLFYISSASSKDTEFYKIYRDFSKKMLIGDPDYFVAQIDCEIAFKPTLHGEVIAPLLAKSTVDAAMRANPEKARREYYCEFTTEAGADAIIKRGTIARNEEIRKPILYNDTGERKIIITWDPARMTDNSVVLVGELYDELGNDGVTSQKVRLINCITLIDRQRNKKTMLQVTKQVEAFREIILEYNQGGDEFYSNIVGIYIDAGSGGQALSITDILMQDWTDKSGVQHKGIIDKEYSVDYIKEYPNAVGKLHFMQPTTYKSDMYEALIQMVNEDHLKFTASYDGKGYLLVINEDKDKLEKERQRLISKYKKNNKMTVSQLEEAVEKELLTVSNVSTSMVKLDKEDESALGNIDALKEELVNMVRIKRDTKDGFELTPEKRNKLHDDRAYACAMMGYALSQERRKNLIKKGKNKKNTSETIDMLANSIHTSSRNYRMMD